MDELWDDYLQYLIWRCHLEDKIYYSHLFEILHHINFSYILDRDDNREEDGIDLRDNYQIPSYFDIRIEEAFYARRVSVLEVLIALAIRVDNEIIGDPAEEHPEIFFLEMLKNLKLDRFKGNCCDKNGVIRIVRLWLDRKFDKDGRGSPFPVKYDPRDQRELEIWDQMNSYISERYG